MSDSMKQSPSFTVSGKCPVVHGGNTHLGTSNLHFWPQALNLDIATAAHP